MTMPNFLIIGAMKSGTTALYYYLRQHPDIYLNPKLKEPRFFCYEGLTLDFKGPADEFVYKTAVTNIEDYHKFFRNADAKRAVGEVSVEYLYVPHTVESICSRIPHARIIAILRNPVDRAYSNYLHWVREGFEPCTNFADALRREPERIRENWAPHWHYVQVGFYCAQLKRYYENFDRAQIRVYLYEDFQTDPVGLVQDIFRFLEVDDSFVPDTSLRHNVSGIPRIRALHVLLNNSHHPIKTLLKPFMPRELRLRLQVQLRNRNLRKPPPLQPALRRQLVEVYRDDILQLQGLLERDLSPWFQVKENEMDGIAG